MFGSRKRSKHHLKVFFNGDYDGGVKPAITPTFKSMRSMRILHCVKNVNWNLHTRILRFYTMRRGGKISYPVVISANQLSLLVVHASLLGHAKSMSLLIHVEGNQTWSRYYSPLGAAWPPDASLSFSATEIRIASQITYC